MGAWGKNKVESSMLNGGQEYTVDSDVSLEQLNAITNNSFYAVDKADEALIKANSAFENNGTVVSVGGNQVISLNFESDPQTQIDELRAELIDYTDRASIRIWDMDEGLYKLAPATPVYYGGATDTNYLFYNNSKFIQIIVDGDNKYFNAFSDVNGKWRYGVTTSTSGTLKNIDIGNIENDFAKADLSNVTYPQAVADGGVYAGAGDRVIETYISSDGNTWYRKYISGWKEFGITINLSGIADHTINFPVEFSNTKYGLTIQNVFRASGSNNFIWTHTAEQYRSTNSTIITNTRISGSATNSTVYVTGCGY